MIYRPSEPVAGEGRRGNREIVVAVLAMSFVMAVMIAYTRDWWCVRAQDFCLPERRVEAPKAEATRSPARAGLRDTLLPTPPQILAITPTADLFEDFEPDASFEFPTPVIVQTPFFDPSFPLDPPTLPVFPTQPRLPTASAGGSALATSSAYPSPTTEASDPATPEASATPIPRSTGYPGPGDESSGESRSHKAQD